MWVALSLSASPNSGRILVWRAEWIGGIDGCGGNLGGVGDLNLMRIGV